MKCHQETKQTDLGNSIKQPIFLGLDHDHDLLSSIEPWFLLTGLYINLMTQHNLLIQVTKLQLQQE